MARLRPPGRPILAKTDRSNTLIEGAAMNLELTSDSFDEGETIPVRHTCDGEDLSPPLSIRGVPDEAESLALIVDDPDAPAGTWVHWVLYRLPAATESLPQGVPADAEVLDGTLQGENDFGDPGWGGPCPPPGEEHRYVFRLYALDGTPEIGSGATKEVLLSAAEAMVVDEARLTGRYQRS